MKAFLFDLDGTIADTVGNILETSFLVCEELDLDWDAAKTKSLIGLPLIQSAGILAGEERAQLYCETYQKHFKQTHSGLVEAFPGMKELLADLKNQGHKLAVVTSKLRPGADRSLESLGLTDFFDAVITASDDCGHKPNPEPALFALKKLGAKAEEAVFVGDSPFDIRCGVAAGIKTIGVLWGVSSREELNAVGAHKIAATVEELRGMLLEG